jgi:diguanylate cyclase (GGDEF)-like protein
VPTPAISANRGLRHNALLITVPRFAGAIILGLGATYSSDIAAKPLAYTGVAVLLLTNLLILASRRFTDRQARQVVAGSVALDFLVMTAVLLEIVSGSTPAYMGHVLIGLEAAFLFRMRGFAVFLIGFAVVGWLPFAERIWMGHDVIFAQFFIQVAGVVIATWAVALLAQESEQRRQEATYLARLNEALALVAKQVMGALRRSQVIDILAARLPELRLPWEFGVLARQADGSLLGPNEVAIDAQAVRQSWAGDDPVVRNPEFLTANQVTAICGNEAGENKDTAVIRCQTANELLAAIVVSGDAANHFSQNDITFLATLGHQACVALDRAALLEHIEELALTDALTQLRNRRAFDERLAEEIIRSDQNGRQLGLIMLDIDHFKLLNDTQGHPAGDRTLQKIGEILQSPALLRPIDLSYRLGGEEFVVLLPGTPLDGAMVVAEKLRALVGKTDFPDATEQPLGHLTVSVGVAVHQPGSGETGMGLIEATDLALYEAKRSGRDCVRSAPVLKPAGPAKSVAG